MSPDSNATTTRSVEVSRVPSGEKITIPAETQVIVTQALGGSFTVLVPSQAGLFRVEGRDADAIGRELPTELAHASDTPLEEALWQQLKTCYDPEIPVNIVDLGLVYSLRVHPSEALGCKVAVEMTLTAPGCGMGPTIAAEARQKLLSVPGVAEAEVGLVWDPPWSPERISIDGKQKLGML